MATSKYPTLNRLLREVQETVGVHPIDGLIGPNTEAALAKALKGYDGNDVIGYLSDYLHREVEKAPEVDIYHDQRMMLPLWYLHARTYIGLKEIAGDKHNPEILKFWKLCHLPFRTDETAWCAGFVGGVLEECGIRSTRSGLARSYLKWGVECEPFIGCVVVFWRGHPDSGSGHVAFLADLPSKILIPVLGGNQGNQVCVKRYPRARLLGYRKPIED